MESSHTVPRAERKEPATETMAVPRNAGATPLKYATALGVLVLAVAAVFLRNWFLFVMGLVYAFAFVAMIAAPRWLANSGEVGDTERPESRGKTDAQAR